MTNFRVELKQNLPSHLGQKVLFSQFRRRSGEVIYEAKRRSVYESPRDEARRKQAEERDFDKKQARKAPQERW